MPQPGRAVESPNEADAAARLKLLSTIPRPLSPNLPVGPGSPPADGSRHAKRKLAQNGSSREGPSGSGSSPPSQPRRPVASSSKTTLADKVIFPRDRLKQLAARYRAKGRELKHAGDKIARENATSTSTVLAVVLQMDAVLLYVYAFWCDDTAAKNCLAQNWQSIFGLLSFVKSRADKANMDIVSGICSWMEAHIFQTLSNHEQKTLAYKSTHLPSDPHLRTSNASDKGVSPGSLTEASPPVSASSVSSSTAPADLLKSFSKATGEIFRIHRHWDESCAALSPLVLANSLPTTWQLCSESNIDVDSGGMILPIKPWRFAWPVGPTTAGGIPHAVAFGRAVLDEWASGEGLGFTLAVVDEAA